MCGIAGIVQSSSHPVTPLVTQMTNALKHRGPDGEGIWTSPAGNAVLGHRRLSIIDLSVSAAQPMQYLNKYHIVYNGEIYNYIEIRESLEKKGYTFRSQSDTEVILAAFDHYGNQLPEMLDGMFAFAIWDEEKKQLMAARDRFGEKPFYYHLSNDGSQFYFASEPKAFRNAGVDMAIHEGALLGFLALNDADQPNNKIGSFFKHIFQLAPAHRMTVDCTARGLKISTIRYWSPISENDHATFSDESVSGILLQKLQESVRNRLRSDVPIGSSFSGGLDSASIAAIIHQMKPAQTSFSHQAFIAGFPGYEKDESTSAAQLAKTFELNCHIIQINEKKFAEEIERVIKHQEEPISSSSVYAQYKVYERAKQEGIKVLIDGQGADELLGGYDQYMHWYLQELIRSGKWHSFLKEKNALTKAGRLKEWKSIYLAAAILPYWTARLRSSNLKRTIAKNGDLSREFVSGCLDQGNYEKPVIRTLNDLLQWASTTHGLPELLRYADRNAMAHGREVRMPFLQHDLAAWLLHMPSSLKIKGGYTKWVLRKSMENHLPSSVVWNKQKIGFEPPQYNWMLQKSVQERIRASKAILVEKKYLTASVLKKNVVPSAAYAAANNDWRYLVAGILVE